MNALDYEAAVARIGRMGARDAVTAMVRLIEAQLAPIAEETGAEFSMALPAEADPAVPGTVPTDPGTIALRCHFGVWSLWFTPDGAGGAVQRLVDARFSVRQCFLARSTGAVEVFLAAADAVRAEDAAESAGEVCEADG